MRAWCTLFSGFRLRACWCCSLPKRTTSSTKMDRRPTFWFKSGRYASSDFGSFCGTTRNSICLNACLCSCFRTGSYQRFCIGTCLDHLIAHRTRSICSMSTWRLTSLFARSSVWIRFSFPPCFAPPTSSSHWSDLWASATTLSRAWAISLNKMAARASSKVLWPNASPLLCTSLVRTTFSA